MKDIIYHVQCIIVYKEHLFIVQIQCYWFICHHDNCSCEDTVSVH